MYSNDEKTHSCVENNAPKLPCDLNAMSSPSASRARTEKEFANFPKQKPALLPKPQISPTDLRFKNLQVKKTQSSSQTVGFVELKPGLNKPITPPKKSHKVRPSPDLVHSFISHDVQHTQSGPNQQAPKISPKPQLPPKTGLKFSKSIENESETVDSSKTEEVATTTPVRPPRSPKRVLKNNPFEIFEAKDKPKVLEPIPWEVHKQKSASLARNENFDWTVRELNKNSKSPIRYYQQTKSSRVITRSPLVEKVPTPRPRLKSKPKLHLELDLATSFSESETPSPSAEKAFPIYASVDYSKKRNRRFRTLEFTSSTTTAATMEEVYHTAYESLDTRRSSDSDSFKSIVDTQDSPERQMTPGNEERFDTPENVEVASGFETPKTESDNKGSPNSLNNNYSCDNHNYNGTDRKDADTDAIVLGGNFEPCSMIPSSPVPASSSFLHRHGAVKEEKEGAEPSKNEIRSFLHSSLEGSGKRNPTKEEKEFKKEEPSKVEEGSPKSFLHSSFEARKPSLTITSMDSFEIVSYEKDCDDGKSVPDIGNDHSIDEGVQSLVQDSVGSLGVHEALSPSSSLDSEHAGVKRFPWIGSFGKGHKKQKEKRCTSQFYTSPDDKSDISEKTRALSLPDIKNTVHDPELLTIYREDREGSTSTGGSINSGSIELPHHSDSDEDKDSLLSHDISLETGRADKPFLIAKELMTSEEVFINVLKLLNIHFRNYVEFRNNEAKMKLIPDADLRKILNHLSEFQSLNEDILADLKVRIDNWDINPKIADVIVKKGAFLKMYTMYIQNFESQTKYLDECILKFPKFGRVVKDFEAMDRCKKLSLKQHMLKPVQRIPQYRLQLSNYLAHLDSSSPDYCDTEKALSIVCEVADHANRSLRHGDKHGRMMHFQSLLSDFELIKPGRELIKDGALEKICRKDVRERYFIVLNDCVLHTTYSKNYLKIHQVLPLAGMKVCYNDEDHPHGFTLYSVTKSFVLLAKSNCERKEWVETLQSAIEAHISRQKTFMIQTPDMKSFKLGMEAPVWIQDNKVTMCQICTEEFTTLFRRHHCRGCGKVICRICGNNQAPIQYRDFKPDRVCDQCFESLLKDYENSEDAICELLKKIKQCDSEEQLRNEYLNVKSKFIKSTATNSLKKRKLIPHRLLEVPANASDSDISGWLHRKSRKSWKAFWFVLKERVLYVYKASEDVVALESIPVLGFEVTTPTGNNDDVDKKCVFMLKHKTQPPLVFHAETEDSCHRWMAALNPATKFDELEDLPT